MRPFTLALGGLIISLAIFFAGSCLMNALHSPNERQAKQDTTSAIRWVRTTRGWEQTDEWSQNSATFHKPRVHPLLIGGMQILISVGVLLALSRNQSTGQRRQPQRTQFPRLYQPG